MPKLLKFVMNKQRTENRSLDSKLKVPVIPLLPV